MPLNGVRSVGEPYLRGKQFMSLILPLRPKPNFRNSRAVQRDRHSDRLAHPLLHEGVPIGAIVIRRMEVRPFTEKQIRFLKPSPIKRSSLSRTCGCLRNCRTQLRIARGAGASDRNGRGARHHQPLAHGRAAGARRHRRKRRAGLWDRRRGTATPRGGRHDRAGSFWSYSHWPRGDQYRRTTVSLDARAWHAPYSRRPCAERFPNVRFR